MGAIKIAPKNPIDYKYLHQCVCFNTFIITYYVKYCKCEIMVDILQKIVYNT